MRRPMVVSRRLTGLVKDASPWLPLRLSSSGSGLGARLQFLRHWYRRRLQ